METERRLSIRLAAPQLAAPQDDCGKRGAQHERRQTHCENEPGPRLQGRRRFQRWPSAFVRVAEVLETTCRASILSEKSPMSTGDSATTQL